MPRRTPKSRQFASEARSSLRNMNGTTRQARVPDATGMLQHLREDLITFWAKHKEPFTDWWLKLPRIDRKDFLLMTSPFMPDNAQTGRIVREGKVEDVSGSLLLMPDFNLQELTMGNKLLEIFAARFNQAEENLENQRGPPQDRCLFGSDLDFEDAELVTNAYNTGRLMPLHPGKEIAMIYGNDGKGEFYTCNTQEAYQRLLDLNLMDRNIYDYTRMRQTTIFQQLEAIIGSYKSDVLGKDMDSTIARVHGCANCGSYNTESGLRGKERLMSCSGCRKVAYCSKECQRHDWKVGGHKHNCKGHQNKQAAEASSEAITPGDGTSS